MLHLHTLRTGKIGNGARYFQDTVVGACRQRELLHGGAQKSDGSVIGLGKLVNHALSHLSIAMNATVVFEACSLNVARLDHTLAYCGAWLARFGLRYVLERHGSDLALNVNAVEQRARNLVHVALYLSRRAATFVRWVVIVAAWAWVHRSDEHKGTWKFNSIF